MKTNINLNIEFNSDLKAAPCNTPLLLLYKDDTTRQDMRAADDFYWPDKDVAAWAIMPSVDAGSFKNLHLPEWARGEVTLDGWWSNAEMNRISRKIGKAHVFVTSFGSVLLDNVLIRPPSALGSGVIFAEHLCKAIEGLE